uniref:NADH dehydrogenase subunit 6 n=1 Tax=Oxyurichthys ophthalmonema TaxID=1003768 RepID=UPI00292A4421|nr:NADH dehydrogenase subunit 6 [Oxyurichthys ophthalmonema]WAB46126.1 NADH dehydrogenase subunit 6 [Oxyurichthys ophthalmonema]
MSLIVFLFMSGVVAGAVGVASNIGPQFAALGVVCMAGASCGMLVVHGASFLALVLFLIYLGGMLVVFAYSAALAADPYPETLGSREVGWKVMVYVLGAGVATGYFIYSGVGLSLDSGSSGEFSLGRPDISGVADLYFSGGEMLVISAWTLLLTLFVVLEVCRGSSRGTLRAV